MPEITSCPDCSKKLRVPDDLLGKKVRCPGCKVMFTAQVFLEANGTVNEDEEPPARRPAQRQTETRPSRKTEEADEEQEDRPRSARADAITNRRPEREERIRDRVEEAPRRRRDEEETEDEDLPRRRRKDETDDEDEDRPRRRIRADEEDEENERPRRRIRAEDEDEDEDDRPRSDSQPWRNIRMGLNFVLIAGWVHMVNLGLALLGMSMMMIFMGGMISSLGGGGIGGIPFLGGLQAAGWGAAIYQYLIMAIGGGATILCFVGCGMCMMTPQRPSSNSRQLAIGSFACQCAMLPWLGFQFLPPRILYEMGTLLVVLMVGLGLIYLVGVVLWFTYLRALCQQLRSNDTGERVMKNLMAWVIFWVGGTVLWFLFLCAGGMMIGATRSGGAAGFFLVLMGLLYLASIAIGLWLYVWYLFVLQDVRGVVERHLARR